MYYEATSASKYIWICQYFYWILSINTGKIQKNTEKWGDLVHTTYMELFVKIYYWKCMQNTEK